MNTAPAAHKSGLSFGFGDNVAYVDADGRYADSGLIVAVLDRCTVAVGQDVFHVGRITSWEPRVLMHQGG